MHPDPDTIIAAWEAGELTDVPAAESLAGAYRTIEQALAPLEQRKAAIRGVLGRIVGRLGGRTAAGGYQLAVTSGGERVSYDVRACDALVAKLAAHGYAQIAEELAQARRVTPVAPSLRISEEKR